MCAFLHGHCLLPPQGYFPCFCCSLSSAGAGVGAWNLHLLWMREMPCVPCLVCEA